jgi:peptide/nickel transport system substrate-binding protein
MVKMNKIEKISEMFKMGKISRRQFVREITKLGLVAAASPLLLSGRSYAATPKSGGRLRLGCGGGATTDRLDPATMNDAMGQVLNHQIRNCLVEVDHKGEALPELAESWESTPDAVKWTFKLRKGVTFHNGKDFEAQDVIDSLNRGDKSKSAAKGIVDPIVDIKADGKHTVVVTLNAGNADFPYILSDYHLAISPAGTDVKGLEKGIGTGPYVMQLYEPGVRFFAQKNPNYWKAGRGHFAEVESICINDTTARTNALMTGQVDYINRVELKTVNLLQRNTKLQINSVPAPRHYSIPMNCGVAPFDNVDVRMALKLAINREEIVNTILRGHGYPGNDHPIGKQQKYYAASIPQRKYDPEKALYHLKKAGLQDHTFKLHTSDGAFNGAVDTAVLYKEQAAKAGIKIELVQEPKDGYWESVWMKKPWTFSWWAGRATADWMFSQAYAADASWTESNWKNERFNQLLTAARAELDEAKRANMYAEMQMITANEGGEIIPMFANVVEAGTKKLKIENPAGNWEFDGNRGPERWWFDA